MGADLAFYRYMVAPASTETTARAGYWAFTLGLRVYVPGLLNPLLALLMRITPHRILIPIVRVLLKPRGASSDDARS
jgi:hypothetical protein